MQAKQALDTLFEGVKFDTQLYHKLVQTNIELITRSQEHSQLFSGRAIGCYFIKYTSSDSALFYDNLFDLTPEHVQEAIEGITSYPKSFKIARDDVNLTTLYIAHRFLSNPSLSDKQKKLYAKEALNYFSYRTLIVITSNYFVYPISEAKATTLVERLNNKYLIKRLKNWSEYCQYRSDEYLESKYGEWLTSFTDDKALPNAVSDLFGRTKDTIKNIYGEFVRMMESDEVIKSKSGIWKDADGQDSIADRIDSSDAYYAKLEALLADSSSFIRSECIAVVVDILPHLSHQSVKELLEQVANYAYADRTSYAQVQSFAQAVVTNAMEYLRRNSVYLSKGVSVPQAMNMLVGNVLYARGTDIEVSRIKEQGDKLLKKVHKVNKVRVNDRTLKNLRNALYLYLVLRAMY